MAKDMIVKYYDKREPWRKRIYYNTLDELLTAKGRFELVGRYICPSWLGIKNIEIDI
jgi:hypothetical protein